MSRSSHLTSDPTTDRTRDLVGRDLAAVWHPFTQHAVWAADEPLVVDRAQGVHLWDTDGKRYLDGVSSLWVTVHGHREPALDEAIRRQLERVAHSTFLGLTHEPGIALAEALLATAPDGLTRVFYAGDGSSAAEAAIKMAFQAAAQRGEHRPLFVSVKEGYHGDTLGAVSVGGIDTFHATYRPILLRTAQIPSPGVAGTQAALAGLAEVLDQTVCAVVVEPMVQAAGGMLTHDAAFLQGVRAACDAAGARMVVDEVATGVGATGRFWAVEHAGVSPDLLVCGKRVTGGYLPLSAVLASEDVYGSFLGAPASGRTFFHGHTYTANPLACAVALANLALMAERGTVAHAAAVGDRIGAALSELSGTAQVRRVGTMTGIEVPSVGERTGFEVCRLARSRGVLIRPLGDVVVLMPPLGIGFDDLDELLGVVIGCVKDTVG
ncbi:MAG: adenosylmethionine--8-amino-7-oxononanoate transaminase [Actinomycetota bacterium]|nr:adenosylmethionine--8-amino-7-oxononanoate transaminase [Actinomycetota bacterium]